MKKINKLILLLAFTFSAVNMQAQDQNNPIAIVIGTNAVDFYPANNLSIPGEMGSGSLFSEYFNISDHWNMIPAVSYLELKYYAGDGFTTRLSGSFNQIKNLGSVPADDLTFYSLGAGIQYNFKHALNTKVFDPFLGVGVGYYWLDKRNASTFDSELGINLWFTDNIAFTIKSSYMNTFEDEDFNYFQHTVGITLAFGGTDSDGDGVYDKFDECPDTPGLAEFNGCPDSDGDGIPDKDDECPDVAGLPEFNGCPDTDGDGIPDHKDECPDVAGLPEFNGCPDTDGDGIPDPKDECPNEAGPKENNGCPYPDTDGDGVLDKDDMCPNVPGTKANNGCPEVTEDVQKELNEYAKTINFNTGKTEISADSEEALKAIMAILEDYPNAKFTVEGHTDSVGSASNNLKLSKARALAVKSYLVRNGVDEFRLSSAGYGEDKPVASNNTKAGRAENRRVEINLVK